MDCENAMEEPENLAIIYHMVKGLVITVVDIK